MEYNHYRQAILTHLPWLEIERFTPVTEGWGSLVFLVNDEYVFRFPRRSGVAAQLGKELSLLSALAGALSVAVPHVNFSWLAVNGENLGFTAYRKIKGDPLDPEAGKSRKLIQQVACVLSDIHRFTIPEVLREYFPQSSTEQWRQGFVDFYLWACENVFPHLNENARTPEKRLWGAFLETPANFEFQPCFIHGDLGGEHILVDREAEQVTGIIDWEDACIGDPALDFVGLYSVGGESLVEAVLDQYCGILGNNFWQRLVFYHAIIPYHQVRYGLEIGDVTQIQAGLLALNARAGISKSWQKMGGFKQ